MVAAEIYTLCGRYDDAMDEIEYVLSLETGFTANDFKFMYWTKPLRELPRYKSLMEEYKYQADF